ncbi:FRQ1 [Symbiodinium sp. CCMP2592]|nr:FRQ1 [Symbiodinium sp. CCMP2592]
MLGRASASNVNGTVQRSTMDDSGHGSSLQSRLKTEFDEVMQSSMQRRLSRLREEVDALCSTLQPRGTTPNGCDSHRQVANMSKASATASPDTKSLCETVAKALRRANRCALEQTKQYGPSEQQVTKADPPEKDEGLVMEGTTLRSSLSSLEQSLASRVKQIGHLTEQLKACEATREERARQAEEAKSKSSMLSGDLSLLLKICQFHLETRRERVEQMSKDTAFQKQQAKYYKSLAHQQRAFYLQSERISACGGKDAIARHKAGELALVAQPATLEDDNTQELFDVGTAVANPYVCDSWPFEPNVLAKRTPQESAMPAFEEETEEDLREAERGFRTNPFRGAGARGFNRGFDDDDDYDRRPSSARSL